MTTRKCLDERKRPRDNLGFVVELVGVAAVAYAAFQISDDAFVRVPATVAAPLVLIVAWAVLVAPNAANWPIATAEGHHRHGLLLVVLEEGGHDPAATPSAGADQRPRRTAPVELARHGEDSRPIRQIRWHFVGPDPAVAVGLERTGRIVTSAAVLMAIVFAAMVVAEVSMLKLLGLGLALAVLVDAFLVRTTLLPAFMRLAGPANWWAPRPLRKLHDRFGLREHDALDQPPLALPEPVPAG